MEPNSESSENMLYMKIIDQQYTRTPFYGSRRMNDQLRLLGYKVNRKRIQRLMRRMGLEAIYPKPRLSIKDKAHKIYPYLLRDVTISQVNQVWSADITYIPMVHGFMYLVAIIEWFSRYVLSWRLSNTLDVDFCLEALEEAFSYGIPAIFNTDQGSQFTSIAFTGRLIKEEKIKISMDGRGRALDNIFVERLWRSVKYEDIYIKDYQTVSELRFGLDKYFKFYNRERPHQSLNGRTPAMVYYNSGYLETA
jgi:putative transposase